MRAAIAAEGHLDLLRNRAISLRQEARRGVSRETPTLLSQLKPRCRQHQRMAHLKFTSAQAQQAVQAAWAAVSRGLDVSKKVRSMPIDIVGCQAFATPRLAGRSPSLPPAPGKPGG